MKKILKEIILGLFGSLAYIFFPILLKIKKQTIFVINYHATYPEYNKNFIKQIKFYKKNFDLIGENYFFKEKKKIPKLNKKLFSLFKDKNEVLKSLSKNYLDSFDKKILNKYKKDKKEARIIAKNGRDTYLKNFNSTIVADFILSKTFDYKSKNKFLWEK